MYIDNLSNGAYLLYGKPFCGKELYVSGYVKEILSSGIKLIFVTTDQKPISIKSSLLKQGLSEELLENILFIDCYTLQSESVSEKAHNIIRVPGPVALTEIQIAFTDFEASIGQSHFVIFDSLSTVLMYSQPVTVSKFLQVLVNKIKRTGSRMLFVMEEGMHDERVITTIEHLMDGIIETKKDEDSFFFKTSSKSATTDWIALTQI